MKKEKKVWVICPQLTRAVKESHDAAIRITGEAMLYCHDFDHVIRVANMAMRIAKDYETGVLAAVAALCHNADRIIQKIGGHGPFAKVDDIWIQNMVMEWLNKEAAGTFSDGDRKLILNAVLKHSEPNKPEDDDVLVCLKDADRVVNISADDIIRKGQYFGDKLPVVDPIHLLNDPAAKFTKPGSLLKSLWFDAVDFMAETGPAALRLPKARLFAHRRAKFFHLFFQEVLVEREEEGLGPADYPTFDEVPG